MNNKVENMMLFGLVEAMSKAGLPVSEGTYEEVVNVSHYLIKDYHLQVVSTGKRGIPKTRTREDIIHNLGLLIKPIIIKNVEQEAVFNQVIDNYFRLAFVPMSSVGDNIIRENYFENPVEKKGKSIVTRIIENIKTNGLIILGILLLILFLNIFFVNNKVDLAKPVLDNLDFRILSIGLIVVSGILFLAGIIALIFPLLSKGDYKYHQTPDIAYFPEIKLPKLRIFTQEENLQIVERMNIKGNSYWSTQKIDIPSTIVVTAENAGHIVPVFVKEYEQKAYLVLIDIELADSHLLPWFEYLLSIFHRRELELSLMYFNEEPFRCWNYTESGQPEYHYLDSLDKDQRLILISSGNGWVNKGREKVFNWLKLALSKWKQKVILSPKEPKDWTSREKALSRFAPVFPASLQGLESAINFLNENSPYQFQRTKKSFQGRKAYKSIQDFSKDMQEQNRNGFLDWVASCAIFPEIYWEMTLAMGLAIEESRGALVNKRGIEDIIQLPWFRKGSFENEEKKFLLNTISVKSEIKARLKLKGIFKKVEESQSLQMSPIEAQLFQIHQSLNLVLLGQIQKNDHNLSKSLKLLDQVRRGKVGNVGLDRFLQEQVRDIFSFRNRLSRQIRAINQSLSSFYLYLSGIGRKLAEDLNRAIFRVFVKPYLKVHDIVESALLFISEAEEIYAINQLLKLRSTQESRLLDLNSRIKSRISKENLGELSFTEGENLFIAQIRELIEIIELIKEEFQLYPEKAEYSVSLTNRSEENHFDEFIISSADEENLQIFRDRYPQLNTDWFEQLKQKAKSVCRIYSNDRFVSTGFLIEGGYLLTSHHVIPDPSFAQKSRVEFGFDESDSVTVFYDLDYQDFIRSSLYELDYSRIRIIDRPDEPLSKWGNLNLIGSYPSSNEILSIIHHPRGRAKELIVINDQVSIWEHRLHYPRSTTKGSAGAPVFDENLNVVAIHHAGGNIQVDEVGTRREVSEGILMKFILKDIIIKQTSGLVKIDTRNNPQKTSVKLGWFQRGMQKAKAVCKIRNAEGHVGTGFLISGGYVITNNHIISSPSIAQYTELEFGFDDPGKPTVFYNLDHTDFITSKKLRYSRIKVKDDPNRPLLQWGSLNLFDGIPNASDSLIIIHHSKGRSKEISFNYGGLSTWEHRLHYIASTEIGSEGSPVFDINWNVIALHFSGGNLQVDEDGNQRWTNEGILMKDILNDIVENITKQDSGPGKIESGSISTYRGALTSDHMLGVKINWLERGAEKAKAVCKIRNADGYVGTGFLIDGGYVITNNYVISSASIAQYTELEFGFDDPGKPTVFYKLDHTDFITSKELDYSRIKVEDDPNNPLVQWGSLDLFGGVPAKNDFLTMIHHPSGRSKEISFSNRGLSTWKHRLHYTASTENGSSGSPVFDINWNVIALHHARGNLPIDEYGTIRRTREGILMRDILTDIQKTENFNDFKNRSFKINDSEIIKRHIDFYPQLDKYWFRQVKQKAKSVCKVHTSDGHIGTGFLIEGGYLLTNNHVIGTRSIAQYSKVEFGFEEPDSITTFYYLDHQDFITSRELDYSRIKIKDKPDEPLSKWGNLELLSYIPKKRDILTIAHHPKGGGKELVVIQAETSTWDHRLHYPKFTTGGGTSGAPVFDMNLKVIGIHHAGGNIPIDKLATIKRSNEAILVKFIQEDISKRTQKKIVYVAYSHSDEEYAKRIVSFFENYPIEVVSDDNLAPGEDFENFSRNSIENSDFIIPIISKNALFSPFLIKDIKQTLDYEEFSKKQKLLPVYTDHGYLSNDWADQFFGRLEEDLKDVEMRLESYLAKERSTSFLEIQKNRLSFALNEFSNVIENLRKRNCVNISEDYFEEGMKKIVDYILK